MKFSSDFNYDLEFGHEGEGRVIGIFNSGAKLEVKRDCKIEETGNLYVEFECRGKPSGIITSMADWWIFQNKDLTLMLWFQREKLLSACQRMIEENSQGIKVMVGGDEDKSKGYLVNQYQLIKHMKQ